MKKETKRLESAERARLESGKKDEFAFDFWKDLEEDFDIKSARRQRAIRLGRALRIPTALFICACILVVCILFLIPRGTSVEPPITDNTTDTETESQASDMSDSTSTDESTESTENSEINSETSAKADSEGSTESESAPDTEMLKSIYDFDYSVVPEGSAAIIPVDLSLVAFGEHYINNSTGYVPDVKSLLYAELGGDGLESLSSSDAPLVLIVHTHGTESYTEHGALYHTYDENEFARSHNAKENVVAVGSVLADVLNRAGIPTVHSTVLHDSVQYKDAYARSAQTVEKYLETYPSIKLVIDVHRDSVINSNGDIIKPITLAEGDRCAQVKCTVGSSWSGEKYDTWEKNLSLALKLRKALNDKYTNICRPVSLESTTYNQQLAPYSMTIEIGASGNSLEEAMCAAGIVGSALIDIVKNI